MLRKLNVALESARMVHPLLFEINTRCWLKELSESASRPVTLANVPDSEFAGWQRLGFTHVWLMGVWTGGPRARAQALSHPELLYAYSEALPDWSESDVAASPYAVADYRVAAELGGNDALRVFRQRLQAFGLKLILDFVPNHLGLDHPWIIEHPEFFVQANTAKPETFALQTQSGQRYLAFGKDPNWSAWTDTVQVEYRSRQARAAMIGLLEEISKLCDGVRCDMAMLVLNDVFQRTWQGFPASGPALATEFWAEAIPATRQCNSDFLFLAEVYWGLEPRLVELGFDYVYDKTLYDRLTCWEPGAVQRHVLQAGAERLNTGAHFLENHDERRVASVLPLEEHRPAALTILGLPGIRFLHEGQLQGWRKRLPVQLVRRAKEPADPEIVMLYERLLRALRTSAVGLGHAEVLVPRPAWAENPTAQHFLLLQWRAAAAPGFDLVVVNLAPHPSQCYAPLKLPTGYARWKATDLLGDQQFVREQERLIQQGLFLDLPAHAGQILHFEPA